MKLEVSVHRRQTRRDEVGKVRRLGFVPWSVSVGRGGESGWLCVALGELETSAKSS